MKYRELVDKMTIEDMELIKKQLGVFAKIINKYKSDKFYGKLEINFENGSPVHCKETKSIKL